MISFIILLLGLLFIFLEFYMPGAILGSIGTVMVIASIIYFSIESNSVAASLLFLAGAIAALILLIRFALWRIPRSKSRFNIYSGKDQAGYIASSYDKTAIGKSGIVVTDLKPGGYIVIKEKKYQAISKTGYLVQGTQVLVTGGEEDNLIVIQKNT